MRFLRFAGSYINTGIAPGAGYRVRTTIRMEQQYSIMPMFGSRASTTSDSAAFNLFYISTWNSSTSKYDNQFRVDYGGTGTDMALPTTSTSGTPTIFEIDFGKTTTINGVSYTSVTDTVGSSNQIYVGTINSGGTLDTRAVRADFSEFTIFNASGVEVFHGVPVKQGSTEYSTTPAPSNCYFDLVSKTYKVMSGGTGVVWYEDTDDNLIDEGATRVNATDYGMKVLAADAQDIAYMNSKYPLFGADISSTTSQFKTYTFTVTGLGQEPTAPFPGYTYDGNFYYGSGTQERTVFTVDTGFKGGNVKSIIMQHSDINTATYMARALEYLRNQVSGENYNSYLEPATKSPPGYANLDSGMLSVVSNNMAEIIIGNGQFAQASFNTLGSFNGGSVNSMYSPPPELKISINDAGILTVKAVVPYNWIQRAFISNIGGTNYYYEARWKDWAWLQGLTITLTVLNTPYTL